MRIIVILLIFCFTHLPQACADSEKLIVNGKEIKSIALTSSDEIEAATNISNSLAVVSKNVSSCMEAGKDNLACKCENKESIHQLNELVNAAIKAYPYWANIKTVKFNGRTLFLTGLRKQATESLECH